MKNSNFEFLEAREHPRCRNRTFGVFEGRLSQKQTAVCKNPAHSNRRLDWFLLLPMRSIIVVPIVALLAPPYSRTTVASFSLSAVSTMNPTTTPATPASRLPASAVSEQAIEDGATQTVRQR